MKCKQIICILLTAASLVQSCSSGKNPESKLKEAERALHRGLLKKAHNAFRRALELGAGLKARKGLALVALRRGDLQQALRYEREIRTNNPHSEESLLTRAQIMEKAGKITRAVALYRALLQKNAEHPEGLFSMARYWIYKGDKKRAVQLLKKLLPLKLQPKLRKNARLLLKNLQ